MLHTLFNVMRCGLFIATQHVLFYRDAARLILPRRGTPRRYKHLKTALQDLTLTSFEAEGISSRIRSTTHTLPIATRCTLLIATR